MLATMGRPKLHDAQTAALLVRHAEQIVEAEGLSCLSLRRLADETGVSTRAVYSLFGGKDALVAALGARAFDWLAESLGAASLSADPAADLVEAGVKGFRRLIVEHPVLFQIGIQGQWPPEMCEPMALAAEAAWRHLLVRTERLAAADQLGKRTAQQAAVEFHALCEGLATMESHGQLARMIGSEPATVWRSSLRALVAGFAVTGGG
jgi:AcrR family transcriptional regulator